MDQNAQTAAQEAQDAQNAAMVAFLKMIASIIGQASEREVKLDDLTLMSGTKKAWPSDNPDLSLTAKIQEAFTNPESKASVRIFLEYADGTKEEIFRQTAGKVVRDPLGLAPAMREMFAKQAADKFTAQQRPKVVIEADSQTVTQTSTVFEALAKTVPVVAATRQDKAEPDKDSAGDSVERSEAIQPSEEKNQILKKELAVVEKSLLNARNNLGSPDFDPVEAQQWVDYFEQKAQSLRAQLGIAEPAAVTVGSVQNTQAVKDTAAVETVQKPETGQFSSKEQMLKGQLAIVDEALDDANRRANTPGFEYLRGEPWFKDLETKGQSLRAQLGIAELASATVEAAQVQPTSQTGKPQTVDLPISQAEHNESVILGAIAMPAVAPVVAQAQAAPLTLELPVQNPITAEERNKQFVLDGVAASMTEMPTQDQPHYDRRQSQARDWISELRIPEIASLRELDSFTGQTIDVIHVKEGAVESNSSIDTGAIQSFLSEATELSTQVEVLRGQVNQHLGDIALFTQALSENINEPQIQQWTQETAAALEVHSQTLGDRLQNAAAGLLETVKDRAANDWKIVVDAVKEKASDNWSKTVAAVQERASDDWAKTVEAVQNRSSTDWEKLQRWAISSDRVDASIDTFLQHVGQNSASGSLAEHGDYVVARKGEERAIFRKETNEPVYKNGLLTDSASSKDSAYVAGFSARVDKVAAEASAIAQTSAKSSALSVGKGR
jgi:hypothetical protein